MSAPELSDREQAIVARFENAPDLPEALPRRVVDARNFVHDRVCPARYRHSPAGCRSMPRWRPLQDALEHLDAKPRDARGARRVLHDADCSSGCGPDSDHADRTQAAEVAALRKFRSAEPAPESYVRQHRMSPTCWCGPTLAPGTKFGVLMHRKPEES